jgi:uncharacterized protein (TIGR02680 family)
MSTLFDHGGGGVIGAAPNGQARPRAERRPDRFRPTRAGLRNVWEYDDAVFHFAGGRMIFRGPNGSGKSNALALLFPFVLDGRAGATHMDPHGGGRNLKSLLLCQRRGDGPRRYEFESRVGYVWLELCRDTLTGPRFVTIGVGARATSARDAETWFFVTDRRVGVDLDLVPEGVPLTRGGLIAALGNRLPPPVDANAAATPVVAPPPPAPDDGLDEDAAETDDEPPDDELEGDVAAPGQPGRRGRRRLVSPCVFDTIEDYQAAVDRALFGMGVDRLRKLVNLVLVLRRPHLAKQLDLDGLSAALSEALSPLADAVIETVAAAFEDLDRIRARLKELRAAVAAVNEALPWYRDYLRTEARARALGLVAAERAALAARRQHQQAERDLSAAAAFVLELEQAQETARVEQRHAAGHLRGLEQSAEYKAVLALDDLAALVSSREVAVRATEDGLAEAEQDADGAADEHQRAAEEAEAAAGVLAARGRGLATSAIAAGIGAGEGVGAVPHLTDADRIDLSGFDPDDLRRRIDTTRRQRAAELRRVQQAIDRARRAEDALAAARRREAEAEERLRAVLGRRQAAAEAVDAARAALAASMAAWIEAARVDASTWNVPADADLSPVVETLGADSAPLARAAAGLLAADRNEAAAEHRDAQRRQQDLAGEAAALHAERERVATEADHDRGPRRAQTRPADRAGRAGAPLFACCDFADHLDTADRAGLEAALEAAGLLDAWVSPGGLADPDALDAFAIPAGAVPDGPRLSTVLVPAPAPDSSLDAATVSGVLDRLAIGSFHPLDGVGTDGRFRLGVLAGRYAKEHAEYIGAAARAGRRRRELARVDAELERLASERQAAIAAEAAAARRRAALDQLVEGLPPTDALAAGLSELDREIGAAQTAENTLEQARHAARADSERLRQAEAVRDAAARTAGVVAVAERLEAVSEALEEFAVLGRDAVDAARARLSALATRDRVAVRLTELERRRGSRAEEARAARERLAEDAARLEAVRASLSGSPEEIHARVEQARLRVQASSDRLSSLDGTLASARVAKGRAEGAVETAAGTLATAERDRAASGSAAAPLSWRTVREAVGGAAAGSVGDALAIGRASGGTDSGAELDADLDLAALASAVIAATDGLATDEDALAAARKGVLDASRRLRDDLSGGYDPSLRPEHDLYLLEVSTDDGLLSLFEAGAQLAEAERVQSLRLSSSEEAMFERHLFTSVVHEIQTRMNETASFVAGINESLAATRTSSGLTVRLRWNRDSDDPGVRSAVELLRHDPEQLDEQRRERLRRFFAGSIEQARAENSGATYAVILPRVLDYRAWHRFHLTIVDAAGTSTRLTPQVFKTLSGGEAAAAVHLPLVAAVDAYLAGADRHAPRLVALDEAFAGIDTHLRGPLLGLLVDFDLDWVIASHELWGNYREIPSCQIYTMRRRPPALGVHTQPTRWNGRALVAGDEG